MIYLRLFLNFLMIGALSFGGGYGYAMAIGVVIFVVSFGLSALVNKVTQREVLEY